MKALLFLLATATLAYAQTAGDFLAKGDAFAAANKNTEALAAYLEADRKNPNDAVILQRLANQYAQLMLDAGTPAEKKEFAEKALEAAERSVEYAPKSSAAYLTRAVIYGRVASFQPNERKMEMSKTIRADAEMAVSLDPKNDTAWYVLGRWHYELANLNPLLKAVAQVIYGKLPDASNTKAVECLEKAVALKPGSVAHHVELGRALVAIDQKEKGKVEIEKGLALPSVAKDDDETKQRGRETLKTLK